MKVVFIPSSLFIIRYEYSEDDISQLKNHVYHKNVQVNGDDSLFIFIEKLRKSIEMLKTFSHHHVYIFYNKKIET